MQCRVVQTMMVEPAFMVVQCFTVVAVQRELGVPVKLVGLGEGPDDLAPFDPEAFVDAMLGESPVD